ncbi:hypothetical protein MYX06_04960, partial [Patescibacteria group bacterium AH-259-L05]|nr:hypothetical protein [Patescibacteria group bacterium AH-259-L05]
SAFWLIPFIVHLDLSSAGVRGFSQWPFHLFYLLFPFQIPYFLLSAAMYVLLTLGGCMLLIKAKKYFIPLLFGALLIFILIRGSIAQFFPDVTLHFSRFFPFLYMVMLAMMAYGFNWIWQQWARKCVRKKIYISIILVVLALHSFVSFDIGTRIKDERLSYISSEWTWEAYPYGREAEELVAKIREFDDAHNVFVQMPADEALVLTGSMNYFTSRIPLLHHQQVITGGYPESSPLTSFIFPTLDAFTKGGVLIWGDIRLRHVLPFYRQDASIHLRRLQMFGVNYIAAYSPGFISTLESLEDVVLIDRTEHFKIFKVAQTHPFAYPAPVKPGLYINADGKIPFKDISLALFSGEHTFDIPMVKGNASIDELDQDIRERFSTLIISGSELSQADIERLQGLDHPLIVINQNNAVSAAFERSDIQFIDTFEVIPKARREPYRQWPVGWEELHNAVRLAFDNFYYESLPFVKAKKVASETIEIQGEGPIIINAGYSPQWQYQNCKTCEVFQVTPANMMIFSTGNAILKYTYDTTKVIGIIISLLSLVIVFLILFFKQKFLH